VIPLPSDYVRDGEIRRAVAVAFEPVGLDSIVDFQDVERPSSCYRVIIGGSFVPGGLALGDECRVRFRVGRNVASPARWEFVGRCVEAPVGQMHA
jgi:hypothetical protein